MKYAFAQVVVVEGEYIGVVVRTPEIDGVYSVYVRTPQQIRTYWERDIEPIIFGGELSREDMELYK